MQLWVSIVFKNAFLLIRQEQKKTHTAVGAHSAQKVHFCLLGKQTSTISFSDMMCFLMKLIYISYISGRMS